VLVGAGKGVIRSMHCNANYHAEVIPVDAAINNLIAIAYRVGTNQEKYVTPLYPILFFFALINRRNIQIRIYLLFIVCFGQCLLCNII